MRTDYYKQLINQEQRRLDEFYEDINNFKMPYKYFKKLNILPLYIVEGEIDKYFDITILLLENYEEAEHIHNLYLEKHLHSVINEEVRSNFCKYYNNIPMSVLSTNWLDFEIMENYKKYKEANIITPSVDIIFRELTDATLNQIVLNTTDNIKYYTQQVIEVEENKKYRIPVRRFPNDSRLLITNHPNHYYSELIIVKICKKIIKFQHRHNGFVRQMKITQLETFLDKEDYKLVDSFDRQTRYCLDDDDNIFLSY